MSRSRMWVALAYLAVLLAMAALLVHLLVWETTRPAPAVEGSGISLVAAAPRTASVRTV